MVSRLILEESAEEEAESLPPLWTRLNRADAVRRGGRAKESELPEEVSEYTEDKELELSGVVGQSLLMTLTQHSGSALVYAIKKSKSLFTWSS